MLVGHDWGAITANALAAHDDSPFARVVSLAVPPFASVAGLDVRLLLRQAPKSWYIAVQPAARTSPSAPTSG